MREQDFGVRMWMVLSVVAVTVVLLDAPRASAAEGGGGVDVSARVVNGVFTFDYPTAGALLNGSGPDTASTWCSGTLIGCRTFLTAAHCVADDPRPSRYQVFLQHAGIFGVSQIVVHPEYRFPVADLAVLTLEREVVGIAPTRLNESQPPPPGTGASIVGFGRSGGSRVDYGLKRAGQVVTATCTGGISNTTSVCWNFEDPLGAPGEDSNTCNGDSGGPLFADLGVGVGSVIAGVTSGGDGADCLAPDASFDANVFHYRDWIRGAAGADLNAAVCGDLPAAGEPGTAILGFTGLVDSTASEATHTFSVPPATAQLRVALNAIDDGRSDFDLFVKRGPTVSLADFDCAQEGANQFGSCEFADPAAGTWSVMVRRYAGSGRYQVTVTTFEKPCSDPGRDGLPCDDGNPCTDNDACSGGRCAGVPSTGTCSDGNDCTSGDACQAGVCVGMPAADGAPCDDGTLCTIGDACRAGTCVPGAAPAAACRRTILSGAGMLRIADRDDDSRDRLSWKWSRGEETTHADFGDPVTGTDYALCVYEDRAGVPERILETRIPAGGGWTATRTGFKYADRTASQDGAQSVVLKAGTEGRASIALRGKGEGLGLARAGLPLSQDPSVTVQLSNGTVCWETVHSTNRANDAAGFRARGD